MNARNGVIAAVIVIIAVVLYFVFSGGGEDQQQQAQDQTQQPAQTQTAETETESGPVRIGGLWGVTGALSSYIPPIDSAVRLANKNVNDQGGILGGREIELVVGDTRADGQTAVAAANRLINVNGVSGIVGALASGATIPAARNAAATSGTVMISPASTSPAITTLEDNDRLFRTVPSDAFQGVAMAQALLARDINKVALTWINNDYGIGLANAFREAFAAQGGEVAGAQVHEPNKSSYRSELAGLARGEAEWLVIIAYADDSGPVLIRQALEGGLFENFVGTDGLRNQEMVDDLGGDNLEGMLITAPGEPEGTEAGERLREMFTEFDEESVGKPFAAQAYDAAFILALAIQAAGSTDRDAIHQAVRRVANAPGTQILPGQWQEAVEALSNGDDIDYVGATGEHEFDENGDVTGVTDVFEVRGGQIEKVDTIQ